MVMIIVIVMIIVMVRIMIIGVFFNDFSLHVFMLVLNFRSN